MQNEAGYESIFYSSHSITLENLSLTVALDNGCIEECVIATQPHDHPVYELQASLSGSFTVEVPEGESVCVRENTLALIPPEIYHSIYADAPAQRFTLRFSFLRSKEDGEDLYGCFRSVYGLTALEDAAELTSLLRRIREECLHPGAASPSLCKVYLSEFFLLLYRRLFAAKAAAGAKSPSLSESDDSNARYNKIEIFISRHIGEPLREEHLAESLGLSVRQTTRLMQSIFGMSFKQKLLQMRLYHAKGLLATTQLPLQTIAAEVGYTSFSGFHLAFKRAFSVTPAEYRAQKQNTDFNFRP